MTSGPNRANEPVASDRVDEEAAAITAERVRSGAADGSLTLAPETSFEVIRKRLGTEPATLADFEAEFGPVQPPDGEG